MEIFQKNKQQSKPFTFELRSIHTEYNELKNITVLKKYSVNSATVTIAKTQSGKGLYLIDEPIMSEDEGHLYSKIMKQLYLSTKPLTNLPKEKIEKFLRNQILQVSESFGISKITDDIFSKLMYFLKRDIQNHGVIGTLMQDSEIEDILCENFNSPIGIIHRKFSELGILNTNIKFNNLKEMNTFVQKLVLQCNKSITAAVPYTDAITVDGHRVSATFNNEISLPGPNFAIRKFSSEPYTITNLVKFNTISSLMAAYVWLLMDVKAFILLVGPTSAGKTTTMGALLAMTDPRGKITTIEDTPELKISHEHWQRLITRKSYSIVESKFDIDMGPLVSLALRSRPDYIVVGEVRGEEASFLAQAAATGHGGLTSFHASDANSALVRLDSPPLNVKLSGQMLIWCFIRQNKVSLNKKIVRRILDITEVIPESNSINLKKLFQWDPATDTFSPNTAKEIVDKSYRLKEIMTLKGLTKDGLVQELESRRKFIDSLVLSNKEKFQNVVEEFALFNMKHNGGCF
ncbi:MAG: type II/IV secretion system ATPase subunit [Nitrosopumilus sp.]